MDLNRQQITFDAVDTRVASVAGPGVAAAGLERFRRWLVHDVAQRARRSHARAPYQQPARAALEADLRCGTNRGMARGAVSGSDAVHELSKEALRIGRQPVVDEVLTALNPTPLRAAEGAGTSTISRHQL